MTFAIIYGTSAFGVILPELELSVPGVLHLATLSALTILAMVAYMACVIVDAGPVPPHWLPDMENPSQVLEVKRKGNAARYCQKCNNYKPPRAHHCRVCKRCVLRMDHHCMWINNCVGHRNYKAFLLFLIYACLALAHANLILSGMVTHMHSLAVDPASHHKKAAPPEARDSASWLLLLGVWRVVLLTGASLLLCCLTLLLGWHLYLLTSNRTTIEYHEGVRACTSSAAKHHAFPHPYNLGLLGNVQEILGYFPGAWLLPSSCAVAGDGLAYPVSRPTLASLHGMGLPSRDLGGSVWGGLGLGAADAASWRAFGGPFTVKPAPDDARLARPLPSRAPSLPSFPELPSLPPSTPPSVKTSTSTGALQLHSRAPQEVPLTPLINLCENTGGEILSSRGDTTP
eukprot:CAMPEP_0114231618 /NCGR_PEP_ID=MMETSP0058-20121206/4150_1 /TAXON_ID=36894 /ORGANISM="Pyramimonas parkeae, CCMP726" /LENGTH=399 /DNA_ID=CAMNT_0001342999 /DNA_START=248 /DNA_END=1447 /DNA_ORIENTATION=+